MRKAFFRVRAQGLQQLRDALDADPSGLLFLGNHSSWWDLYLAHLLNEAVPVDGYGMMEHFNLVRFGFFRRIGAFSVDRSDPLAVRAALDYTAELLARPRSGVWLFPQGRVAANDIRPLGFQPGLRGLLRRTGRLRMVPIALRYEFWQDERPEVFVRIGTPAWVERSRPAHPAPHLGIAPGRRTRRPQSRRHRPVTRPLHHPLPRHLLNLRPLRPLSRPALWRNPKSPRPWIDRQAFVPFDVSSQSIILPATRVGPLPTLAGAQS